MLLVHRHQFRTEELAVNKFQQQWQTWEEKFINLTQREKIIIIVATVFLSGFGLFKMLIEPSAAILSTSNAQKTTVANELQTTQLQVSEIENALSTDPNEKIKQEIKVIREQIKKVEADLNQVMTEYVAPEQMASALTNLLMTSSNIRVIGMTVLPPEKVQDSSDDSVPNYYRHLFEINIEGDYFSLMEFVKKVSVVSSQFNVQNLNYKVQSYPTAVMTLTLITISDNEKVIRL